MMLFCVLFTVIDGGGPPQYVILGTNVPWFCGVPIVLPSPAWQLYEGTLRLCSTKVWNRIVQIELFITSRSC